ncbi:hypothetical protein niasHS_004658 [Heterodera schachtii]|uniref:Uncharacterized protein n=1 Tax=Heterodera schachtii TaxID=97005 RepID=A0ABD2JMJ7_HETSC
MDFGKVPNGTGRVLSSFRDPTNLQAKTQRMTHLVPKLRCLTIIRSSKTLPKPKGTVWRKPVNFSTSKEMPTSLEIWILAEETFRDPTNLQAKIQKHDAFVAKVQTGIRPLPHSNAMTKLDKTGNDMIQPRASSCIRRWDFSICEVGKGGFNQTDPSSAVQTVLIRLRHSALSIRITNATLLATNNFWRDLNTALTQRKHKGPKRDLAALESKVDKLGTETNQFVQTAPLHDR